MHHLLKDYLFVRMIEVEEMEDKGDGLNANNYEYHCIRFYNIQVKKNTPLKLN